MSWMKDMASAEAAHTQHTPGPWRAHRYDALGIVTENQRDTIAKAYTLADAQLIIAAPDLLAALIMMRDVNYESSFQLPFTVSQCRMIDAAIDKATNRGEAAP